MILLSLLWLQNKTNKQTHKQKQKQEKAREFIYHIDTDTV